MEWVSPIHFNLCMTLFQFHTFESSHFSCEVRRFKCGWLIDWERKGLGRGENKRKEKKGRRRSIEYFGYKFIPASPKLNDWFRLNENIFSSLSKEAKNLLFRISWATRILFINQSFPLILNKKLTHTDMSSFPNLTYQPLFNFYNIIHF